MNKGRRKKISRDEEIIRQRGNFKETKGTKGQRKRWIRGRRSREGRTLFVSRKYPFSVCSQRVIIYEVYRQWG